MRLYLISTVMLLFCTDGETNITYNATTESITKNSAKFNKRGRKVSITEHPYIVSLFSYRQDNFQGTAVLLNKHWAITAAVNVILNQHYPKEVFVRVGSNCAFANGNITRLQKIVIHPEYSSFKWGNDLALIKLKKPLKKFDDSTRPIEICSELLRPGLKAVVAGYQGKVFVTKTDGLLREAKVPIARFKDCKARRPELSLNSICTYKKRGGHCPLDCGSPLVYENKLIGIFSGRGGCDSNQNPAIYAHVREYKIWIKNTIRN